MSKYNTIHPLIIKLQPIITNFSEIQWFHLERQGHLLLKILLEGLLFPNVIVNVTVFTDANVHDNGNDDLAVEIVLFLFKESRANSKQILSTIRIIYKICKQMYQNGYV